MSTNTFSATQSGHSTGDRTSWKDGTSFPYILSPSGVDSIGLVFDLGTDATRIVKPEKIILTPHFAMGSRSDVSINIYVLDELAPSDYSSSLIPGLRGEEVPENLVCQANGDSKVGEFDWEVEIPFEFELGRRYVDHQWQDDPLLQKNWNRFWGASMRHSDWSGRIAFTHDHLQVEEGFLTPEYHATGSLPEQRPVLQCLQWSAHTGHLNWPLDRGRSVHDGRSGLPAMSLDLVEDGFVPGLWVKPDKRDEEDHSLEAELPDSEGAVTDEIP